MNNGIRLAGAAVIIAVGMILSSVLLSKFFVRIRHEQTITVKGTAETTIMSDIGKIFCTWMVRGGNLGESYARLQDNKNRVATFLKHHGFTEEEIRLETVQTIKVCKRDENGKEMNVIEFYDVSQGVMVTSTNTALVKDVATSIMALIKEGVEISVSPPEFFASDNTIKDTKLQLLGKATEDGYRRALVLAESSRGEVGALVSAGQGVFQITAPYSTDTSGSGIYDTSTIEKTAKAIVTLEYAIKAER